MIRESVKGIKGFSKSFFLKPTSYIETQKKWLKTELMMEEELTETLIEKNRKK